MSSQISPVTVTKPATVTTPATVNTPATVTTPDTVTTPTTTPATDTRPDTKPPDEEAFLDDDVEVLSLAGECKSACVNIHINSIFTTDK